jgi:hypothetical protein
MVNISIHWRRVVQQEGIPRSSHVIAVLSSRTILVYGGEIKPREPVDNRLYSVSLTGNGWCFAYVISPYVILICL